MSRLAQARITNVSAAIAEAKPIGAGAATTWVSPTVVTDAITAAAVATTKVLILPPSKPMIRSLAQHPTSRWVHW